MLKPGFGAKLTQEIGREELEELGRRVKVKLNFDLSSYKPKVLHRRLRTRLRAKGCESLSSYLEELARDPGEWRLLYKALIINVSSFFRNPETFVFLARTVLPEIFREKAIRGEGALFVSAACAEGEEPYSLAIALLAGFPAELKRTPVRIIGIDVDGDALEQAARGRYPEDRMKETPPRYLERYFTVKEKRYQVAEAARAMVEFQQRDLRQDLDLADADLIMCRNLLIYFSRDWQQRIIDSFKRALRPGGYLALGKTETMIGEMRSGFEVVDLTEHVYRKSGV